MSLRPAVFLDRDGTLNVERSFLTSPLQMQLLPGAAKSIRLLTSAGLACVVVTNQCAVGRGLMTENDLHEIHEEMKRQLAESGVALDAIYAATAAPPTDGEPEHPDRKPNPGMLLRAAAELQLDIAKSWLIGDSLRDILAGKRAGCRGCILVRSGHPVDEQCIANACHVAEDVLAAARHILKSSGPPGS